jgi:hypothetical protein
MEVATAKQLFPTVHPPRDLTSPSSSTSSSSAAAYPTSSRLQPHNPLPPSPKPLTPRVIDTTPFPTTFVQADTASFKQVVQMLTGSETAPSSAQKPAAAATKNHHHQNQPGVPCRPKNPGFKLYERRKGLKNLKMIGPLAMAAAAGLSPRNLKKPEVLSPSVLDFPSLALGSPVTPLVADPFSRSPASSTSPGEGEAAERAAIERKGFFLHPSPRSAEPPRLLPLFPVTSPRLASSAAPPASQ